MTSPQAEGRATVGPFRIEPQGEGARGYWLHDDNGEYVAKVCKRYIRAEEEAHAHLFAAAPELLEALEGLLAHPGTHHSGCIHWHTVGCDCEFSEVANAARDAIAKARGQ